MIFWHLVGPKSNVASSNLDLAKHFFLLQLGDVHFSLLMITSSKSEKVENKPTKSDMSSIWPVLQTAEFGLKLANNVI